MTAKWEAYLKKIGTGNGSSELFLGSIAKYLNQLIQDVPNQLNDKTFHMTTETFVSRKEVATCPTCKKEPLLQGRIFMVVQGIKKDVNKLFRPHS
ncbi:hypothetical protein JQK62_22270, partial [Leptospira santarosai]|nr:hypothetical protein [Leptospira santarosai]